MTVWYFNLLQLIYPGPARGPGKSGVIVTPAKGFRKLKARGKAFYKAALNPPHQGNRKNTCNIVIVQRGSLRRRRLGSLGGRAPVSSVTT